jgi:hypothetical protein
MFPSRIRATQWAIDLFRERVTTGILAPRWERTIRDGLRGHDLCCWCSLDQPCHADVLLEIANIPKCLDQQLQEQI